MTTKLIPAIPGMHEPVTDSEVETFLESKLNKELATLDEEGYPNIQPVRFYYDKGSTVIYTGTQKRTTKVRNIGTVPDKIYFSIDDENFPTRESNGECI
jgi:general stress protein 26